MEYAEESKETTYFDEEAAAAKEAVEGVHRVHNLAFVGTILRYIGQSLSAQHKHRRLRGNLLKENRGNEKRGRGE